MTNPVITDFILPCLALPLVEKNYPIGPLWDRKCYHQLLLEAIFETGTCPDLSVPRTCPEILPSLLHLCEEILTKLSSFKVILMLTAFHVSFLRQIEGIGSKITHCCVATAKNVCVCCHRKGVATLMPSGVASGNASKHCLISNLGVFSVYV